MRLLPERSEIVPILFRLGGFAALFVVVVIVLFGLAGRPESLAAFGSLQFVGALVASAIVLRMDGRRSLPDIGLPRRGAGRGLLLGTLLGVAFVLPAVAIAIGLGGLRYGLEGGTVIEYAATGMWTGLILLPAAASEEIAVRGYPLRVLLDRWGPWPALAVTSAAFSVLHGANPNVGRMALLNIVLAGVLLGLLCLKTGDLWWATGVHTGWNLATGFVADLPVSGLELVDAPLIEVSAIGTAWVTGGDFGLEGGLSATVALALAILIVARTRIVPARWLAARGQIPAEETE
ncbi:MAG: CPBP family intramembrane metalloprotease [Gemmatimonadetes bacterium]|nr:CPBP family intramembrane metalloprotease [Gemmatimonadota bacterium]MYA63638.1 CPBP family intramembrane metalloprotease [Gemmatimonadota bacterium]MYB97312.1 CPBP family intramembrane metalloprotease [Gemmatimonadota bacterium]MYH53019.1 CPBP family intramembrane metalloprotease [Gemmatimonadota bacterium]MYI45608.1 CPBP family intramembrane metalloprotease [Gemmatimonadota bacterium]